MPASNSLDFLMTDVENFQHFLFEAAKILEVLHNL